MGVGGGGQEHVALPPREPPDLCPTRPPWPWIGIQIHSHKTRTPSPGLSFRVREVSIIYDSTLCTWSGGGSVPGSRGAEDRSNRLNIESTRRIPETDI